MDSKKIAILEYFMEKDRYVTAKELSKYIEVSEKTISRYIKDMNYFLQKYELKVESAKGLGYKLNIAEHEKARLLNIVKENKNFFRQDTTHYRIECIIKIIMQNKKVTLQKLIQETYFSESTVRTYLEKVKIHLQKYDLKLLTKNSDSIEINGELENILKCQLDILQGKSLEQKQQFLSEIGHIEIIRIYEIVKKEIFYNNLYMSNFEIELFFNIVCVMVNSIRMHQIWNKKYIPKNKNKILKEIIKKVCFAMQIVDKKGFDNFLYEAYESVIYPADDRYFIHLKEDILQILQNFPQISLENFYKDESLIDNLVFHIKKFIQRSLEQIYVDNPIIEDIKKKYSWEFSIAFYICKEIEKKYPCKLSENEIGFIAIYLAMYQENQIRDKKRIVILCHYGLGTANLIKEKINHHFNNVEIIGIYSFSFKEMIEKEKPDLIVSSIYLEKSDIPWVYVKNIFEENFILEIERRLDFNQSKSIASIKKLVSKENFFILDQKTPKQVILEIKKLMEQEKIIDSNVISEILEREEISSTEIGNMVAIPHALSQNQKVSTTVLIKLKNPILWGKEMVQLVFLIAFNDKDKENLVAFKGLYKLIENENNIKALVENFNYKNFMNILSTLK